MGNDFSVVVPVHNEERFLPFSLAGLLKADVDEVIFVLDRCQDRSSEMVYKFKKLAPFKVITIQKDWKRWRNSVAENFELGFSLSGGRFIYCWAADLLCDPAIFQESLFEKWDLLCFGYYNYGLYNRRPLREGWTNFIRRFSPFMHRTDLTGGRREVWEKVHFRDVTYEGKDFVLRAKKYFRVGFVRSHILHLRPKWIKPDFKSLSFGRSLLRSALLLRPELVVDALRNKL